MSQRGQPVVLERPHVHVVAELAAGRHRQRGPHRRAAGDLRRAIAPDDHDAAELRLVLLNRQRRREEILGLDRHPLERSVEGGALSRLERVERRLLRLGGLGHHRELPVIEQRVGFHRSEAVTQAHDQHRPRAAEPQHVPAHAKPVLGGVERVRDAHLRSAPPRRERERLTRLLHLHARGARGERQVGERGRVRTHHQPVGEQRLSRRHQLHVRSRVPGREGAVLQQLGPDQPCAPRAEAEAVEGRSHPDGLGGQRGARNLRWPRRRGRRRCGLRHGRLGHRAVRRTAGSPHRRFRREQDDRQGDDEERQGDEQDDASFHYSIPWRLGNLASGVQFFGTGSYPPG